MHAARIPLTEYQRQHMNRRVASGEFADEGSYLQFLVALDAQRLRDLDAAIQEGLDSGISDRTVEEIMAEAKRKLHEAGGQ